MYEYNLGIRFQRVAAEQGTQPALRFSQTEIHSYLSLNSQANRIARWLLANDVSLRDVVCISGNKSFQTFAWIIACLKIGAIYSIFDPDSPIERLRKIFSVCRPRLVIAERDVLIPLGETNVDLGITPVDKHSQLIANELLQLEDDNLPETLRVTEAEAAYIMFTSGSTGFPKGAVMTHRNVLNLIEWSRTTYSISATDILTNVNPLFFDNSVFDLYASIFNKACLVPFTKEEVQDPLQLVQKVDEAKCSLWFSVPSLLIFLQTMKATDGRHLRSIRRFIFGGEGYPKTKLKALYDIYSSTSEFFNVYGPTECTCICSNYKITDADFDDLQGLPPLGSLAENFSYLILYEEGQELLIGELCLRGPNVGLGYYNEPELTARQFVQNPFSDKLHEVMYKTGDLVRLDPDDGKLWIHGRKDNQIKHMGYRIELEEIEAALNSLSYVAEAAVLHTERNGFSKIVAVMSGEEVDNERIKADLRQLIPDYMLPATFYQEPLLPKNANGKIDRRSLAAKYLR